MIAPLLRTIRDEAARDRDDTPRGCDSWPGLDERVRELDVAIDVFENEYLHVGYVGERIAAGVAKATGPTLLTGLFLGGVVGCALGMMIIRWLA